MYEREEKRGAAAEILTSPSRLAQYAVRQGFPSLQAAKLHLIKVTIG